MNAAEAPAPERERGQQPHSGGGKDDTPAVSLRGLTKRFGPVTAVEGVDLDIRDGEFFAMLGPSGSGKTTVLRLIAGFEAPTAGRIELTGQDVTRLAPFEREVNTVFQDYALFPHMTVLDNVAYGLRIRRIPKAERQQRAEEALSTVRLPGVAGRRPSQLSGGQQQRVALARALAVGPRVLLLDEPLGALDLKLRQEMQVELKHLQRQVGITFVFVTHDQEEALTMADRLAVFDNGRVEQVGNATDVYEHPATTFVAGFVGTSNLIQPPTAERLLGERGLFSIRPEKVRVLRAGEVPAERECTATGEVSDLVYVGASTQVVVNLTSGERMLALQQNIENADEVQRLFGQQVKLAWRREHCFRLAEAGREGMG